MAALASIPLACTRAHVPLATRAQLAAMSSTIVLRILARMVERAHHHQLHIPVSALPVSQVLCARPSAINAQWVSVRTEALASVA